jgi:hypothetical protein
MIVDSIQHVGEPCFQEALRYSALPNVGSWPLASLSVTQWHGRFRGRSGHRAAVANLSLLTLSDRLILVQRNMRLLAD